MECCATLEAPSGVVGSGVTVSVHYAIILDGPFEFPEEWERTSVVLYIDCPEKQLLKELLCIKLRHWAVCPSDALAIMKADHTFTGVYGKDEFVFAQLNDFSDCQSFSDAVLFGLMDHFCLICTAMKCTRSANLSPCHTSCYLMKVPDNIEAAEFRVFLMYGVPSWIDVRSLLIHQLHHVTSYIFFKWPSYIHVGCTRILYARGQKWEITKRSKENCCLSTFCCTVHSKTIWTRMVFVDV